MSSERLMRAFGQIEDSYILEAAPPLPNRKKKEKTMAVVFRRPAAAAAAVALWIGITGTALAAANGLPGFFQDVFRWDGAVVGTTYEQATQEVDVTIRKEADQLLVELTLRYPEKFPYRGLEMLGIGSYDLLDGNHRRAVKGAATEMAALKQGKTTVRIPLEGLPEGEYRLVIQELTGGKKTEHPLPIRGRWECLFTR